mmetsp:Transcript_26587/g.74367  ORF Transcript_26587/g.74367 Transcript_26587/m.74367 type:complete len:230 (+) Transcript_26587:888-1577(+)
MVPLMGCSMVSLSGRMLALLLVQQLDIWWAFHWVIETVTRLVARWAMLSVRSSGCLWGRASWLASAMMSATMLAPHHFQSVNPRRLHPRPLHLHPRPRPLRPLHPRSLRRQFLFHSPQSVPCRPHPRQLLHSSRWPWSAELVYRPRRSRHRVLAASSGSSLAAGLETRICTSLLSFLQGCRISLTSLWRTTSRPGPADAVVPGYLLPVAPEPLHGTGSVAGTRAPALPS